MEGEIEKVQGVIAQQALSNQDEIVKTLNSKRQQIFEQIHNIEQQMSSITETHKQRISDLTNQKQPLEEALGHIDALLRLEGGNNKGSDNSESSQRSLSESSVRLTDIAYEILMENGRPIHYRDLAKIIQAKNIVIPGKDAAATLLTRISRDRRFKRTKKRGIYALKVQSAKKVAPKRRKNNKRKVKA